MLFVFRLIIFVKQLPVSGSQFKLKPKWLKFKMKASTFVRKERVLTSFIACVVLAASCSNDQNSQGTKGIAEERNNGKFDNNKQRQDAQFLVNAAEINMEGIQLGQLAQQKGRTTHIKELGKAMEDAHTKSQRDLRALAQRKNISIPSSPTENTKDAYKTLKEESENDFDEAYADMMVSKHKYTIDIFEDASSDSHDADIRNWATAMLPALREHLDHSTDCQRKLEDM